MKRKIISIMNEAPPYDTYKNISSAAILWKTSNGKNIGIWGYDWADLIAKHILLKSNQFEIEVWQPDYLADKIYSYNFDQGWVHKLFPAQMIEEKLGFKRRKILHSNEILSAIKNFNCNSTLIHLHGLTTFDQNIIECNKGNFVMVTMHGNLGSQKSKIFKLRKNIIASFYYFKEYLRLKKCLKNVECLIYQTNETLKNLKKLYKKRTAKLTMGVNFDKFKKTNKSESRIKLGLPCDKKILLYVGRLEKAKQVDKLIKVLSTLNKEHDFICLIVGHGPSYYEKELYKIGKRLINSNKIVFTGYKKPEELVDYYNAADLFIMTSKSEAGPVVCMEAMACGVPIMMTKVGNTSEVLLQHNSGCILKKSSSSWKKEIKRFLAGGEIRVLDMDIARSHYDWDTIAEKYIKIIDEIE